MHAFLILFGAIVVVAYLAGRFGRRSQVASAAATVSEAETPPGSLRRTGNAILFVLALPFIGRVLLGVLTVLGLLYVYFFGPIKPVHEWLH